jgi:hypothetical protein
MHSKVSSDWLPSYSKVIPPVLEIFKMAGYFPDGPRMTVGIRAWWWRCKESDTGSGLTNESPEFSEGCVERQNYIGRFWTLGG